MSHDNIWQEFESELDKKETKKAELCCDSPYISELDGFAVCVNCGVVKTAGVIDDNQQFCEFGEAYHTKTSFLYPSSSATTMSGNSRLSKIQHWNSMPYDEKVLFQIANIMKAKMRNYFQPRLIEDSVANFKMLDGKKGADGKKEVHRGRIRDGLIAACVYFACKSSGIVKTPEEISAIMQVDTTTFNNCTKIYTRIMGQKQESVSAVDFVDSYCSRINLPGISFKVQVLIKKICGAVESLGFLDGSIPQNITAGCILFTANEMELSVSRNLMLDLFSISAFTLTKINNTVMAHKKQVYEYIHAKR
jgi:transcription initiation factor TFIIB